MTMLPRTRLAVLGAELQANNSLPDIDLGITSKCHVMSCTQRE